jgi:hypothetical protein
MYSHMPDSAHLAAKPLHSQGPLSTGGRVRRHPFAVHYARSYGLAPEQLESHLLHACLYPHARWINVALRRWWPDLFAVDREFLSYVLRLRRPGDFSYEATLFVQASRQRRRLRHWLRLRVSAGRARQELRRVNFVG